MLLSSSLTFNAGPRKRTITRVPGHARRGPRFASLVSTRPTYRTRGVVSAGFSALPLDPEVLELPDEPEPELEPELELGALSEQPPAIQQAKRAARASANG